MSVNNKPPEFAKRILRWFVNAEYLEEVEGDLDEIFAERLLTYSSFRAKLLYLHDVIRAIRPYHPKRKSTEIGHEILNWIFLKLALRNLLKQKTHSFINIIGLSVGLVSFLLIISYVAFEKSYDSFHIQKHNIYRVAFDWGETDYHGNNSSIYASSVPALGPAFLREISEVKNFTRFIPVLTVKPYCVFTYFKNSQIQYSGNADHGLFADSSFLKIFSFPIYAGSPDPLRSPRSIAITRSFAQKIFGDVSTDKILGASIEVDSKEKEDHIVTAILEDVPSNSQMQFDYLISYATINSDRLEGNLGWSQFYTYVLTHQPVSTLTIQPQLQRLKAKLYGPDSPISIFLQPLEEIYLFSKLREEVGPTGSVQQLTFLTIIAYIILFMAWINYVNMFLARAMERVNEIGVKKVLGSSRIHLIVQFFTEAMMINMLSFVLGFLLLLIVRRPFEVWLGKDISFALHNDVSLMAFVLAVVAIGSTIAGLYPAIVLASYKPTHTLGKKHHASEGGIFFKNGLVYFQFVVSFIIVASTLIVNRQINFMKNADLGMQLDGCVAIRTPGDVDSTYVDKMKLAKERLLQYPFIKNVSTTSTVPGKSITTSGGVQRVVGPELEGNNVFFLKVDEQFLDAYGIRLIAGKNFSEKVSEVPVVMLNEAALKTLKFESAEEAINHRIHWQRREYQVIGVFGNYNHLFLKEAFEPIMLSYSPAALGFITLKIRNGYYEEAITSARKEVEKLFPGKPFEFSFLQSAYNHQYHGIQQFETLTKYFALLAILIACLGLFALSYYASQRRIKEIAVRKVFGAGGLDVMVLLSYSYIRMALISGVVGSCIAFYVMSKWLANFAFAVSLRVVDFLVPLSMITVIVLITVGYNCLRVSSTNPSKSLKHI